MQLGFYFDQTRCTGCFACCIACKDWHDIPAGPVHWIRVSSTEKGEFPSVFVSYYAGACYHCEKPACAEACPSLAIAKRANDGIVVVDSERCTGCRACLEACPYGVPQFADEAGATMQKCDLCAERWQQSKKPLCVDACPMRALDAGPLEELRRKYGANNEAVGFTYSASVRPCIVIKPKPIPASVANSPKFRS
ncbi:MAG: 4Fe-4S dicluster domain-containing protein [Terriglobales bacterium]